MKHKQTTCCNHNCNQSRTCPNAYRTHFNHLGEPIEQEPPFVPTDLIIIAMAVIGTAVLLSGVV